MWGGVLFVTLTDNPRHGIGGNFEWAIKHATGDYIFICGQDDVWLPSKVECVASVFENHLDAVLVAHQMEAINVNGEPILNITNRHFETVPMDKMGVKRIPRDEFLERAVCTVLIGGPSMCLHFSLKESCFPLPMDSMEDQWLGFCGIANNGVYFINETLTSYRIHDSATHSVGITKRELFGKRIRRIQTICDTQNDLFEYGRAVLKYLDSLELPENTAAVQGTAQRIVDIGEKVSKAFNAGRIYGSYQLIKLYCTDMRYRRMGKGNFLTSLAAIILYGKTKRRR